MTLENAALVFQKAVKFEARYILFTLLLKSISKSVNFDRLEFYHRELEERSFSLCNSQLNAVSQTKSYKAWDELTCKAFIQRVSNEWH